MQSKIPFRMEIPLKYTVSYNTSLKESVFLIGLNIHPCTTDMLSTTVCSM